MDKLDLLADKIDFVYKKEETPGDVRSLVAICLNYWYVFFIGIIVCVLGVFVYIQYEPSKWNISSKIIVEDDKNTPAKALTNGVNSDLASLFDIKSNADNEVKVLKSRSLIKKVVYLLDLNMHVYDNNGFRKVEVFEDAPFTVNIGYKTDKLKLSEYSMEVLGSNTFRLINGKSGEDVAGTFDKPVSLNQYNLTFHKTKYFKPEGDYKVKIQTPKQVEKDLDENLGVGLDDKQATVIDLNLSYSNPDRGRVILQKLMDVYLQNNLANKVRIADSTMKFIDRRLVVVGAELGKVEKNLEQYKVQNKISDINAQSKALIEGANAYQNKLNDNEVQLAIANDLFKYVSDAANPQVVPSSLITKDMAFGTAINGYNEMLLRKEQLRMTLTDNSVVITNLDQQIELARKALLSSLNNYRNSLQVSQAAVKKQNAGIEDKITSAPTKERIYLDYAREQSLKQDLYLFLLQKREETAISQTATLSSCRILDNADADEKPFAPKKSLLYLIGLVAGICIPAAGISIKEMLNTRINTKADIDKHTSVPLFGEISRGEKRVKSLVYNDARSTIAEEIRALRTSLKYVTDTKNSNVIMFTSSMSGEGKSFISLNLANSIALTGKRVVLLELDLRKPKLLKNIGSANDEYGFTNYVISPDGCVDCLLNPSENNPNFFYISSGPVPPNPAELLMDDRLKNLIGDLKKRFDYVIIDTAPVGLVSDALIIEEFVDVTFYVVRQNYTLKTQLGIVNDLHKTRKAKHMYLIVNDIEMRTNNITGYGHGYGSYGYGSPYDDNKSKVAEWLKKIKMNVW
ncbi:GumC family protein [Mucilaginibacter celer]|uniref:Polysaccharide biosynthesis tyrosine autokinase n=1 Tax=Mucilaginibacter celer TaxID=2305508 RepID=A0A494VKR3_9SPHI|nr:tyrosine-protein kinase [Mucilaginibacter celer]AYL94589.1 polysaccharide biosynthesis tyrosine autokinase [Mucilaginibacter celer]